MKTVMVRYKVKADRAAENERLIRAVFAQLDRDKPEGVLYASLRLDDGVSFVHIASIEERDGANPLTTLAAFTEFAAQIRERCEEPPVSVTLTAIGTYPRLDDV